MKFEKRRKGKYYDPDSGQRGKWWQLKKEEVEEAFINYVEKTHGEKIPPRDEIEVEITLGDKCKEAEIVIKGKKKK